MRTNQEKVLVQEKVSVPRFMIGAAGSGSGKTTVTCGLLAAFLARGIRTISFKCGPDYIDPMFHTEVLGIPSRNLDLFFTDEKTTVGLMTKGAVSQDCQLAVIEGVMGYYDGLAGISTEASSYDLARVTKTPVVLLLDCKGKSVSLLAEIKGFLEYRPNSQIRGVILNRLSPMLYPELKGMIQEELGIQVFGYLPVMEDCGLESRHLGLVTAKEVGNLREITERLGAQMSQTVDLDGIFAMAKEAPSLDLDSGLGKGEGAGSGHQPSKVRIGIAQDKAFCFYYQDNLDLLTELGAELVPFSPLTDRQLPEKLAGLYIGGGYPELYLDRLSENRTLMEEIRGGLESGMPCIAECGGFMYLHQWISDREGKKYSMVGAISGESFPTGKLQRFGYIRLTASRDTVLCGAGESLPGHEFHYWDSTNTGDACRAEKPLRNRGWDCIVTDGKNSKGNLFAGYPHVHLCQNPRGARRFIEACQRRMHMTSP